MSDSKKIEHATDMNEIMSNGMKSAQAQDVLFQLKNSTLTQKEIKHGSEMDSALEDDSSSTSERQNIPKEQKMIEVSYRVSNYNLLFCSFIIWSNYCSRRKKIWN